MTNDQGSAIDTGQESKALAPKVLQVELRAGNDPAWRPCELSEGDGGLHLSRSGGEFDLKDEMLAGLHHSEGMLVLFPSAGGRVEFRGSPELEMVARRIIERVCSMREFTRPLRGLGTRRGKPGPEHDAWFAPLIAARHRAEGERTPDGKINAFDADALARSIEQVMGAFASARYPDSAPERRALFETLRELAEPLLVRIARSGIAATGAKQALPETQFVRWRDWLDAVDAVFAAADRCWLEMLGPLG